MSAFIGPQFMAATGSTGNNTHAGVGAFPGCNDTAFNFIVEAVGATPTITFKFQGALEPAAGPGGANDAAANWVDLALLPANSETVTAAPAAVTATGANVFYLAQAHVRFVRRFRVVTSANTNVTYRCEMHQQTLL